MGGRKAENEKSCRVIASNRQAGLLRCSLLVFSALSSVQLVVIGQEGGQTTVGERVAEQALDG